MIIINIGTEKEIISIAIKIPPNGERTIINANSEDTIEEILRLHLNINVHQYILVKPILNERFVLIIYFH